MRGSFFFFNDTATTEIYTLSLHDALPIYAVAAGDEVGRAVTARAAHPDCVEQFRSRHRTRFRQERDRKSTRLNSSHANISDAVFCLKKKNLIKIVDVLSISQALTPILPSR